MSEEQSTPQSAVEYRLVDGFPAYRVGSDGTVQSLWVRTNIHGYAHHIGAQWKTLACAPSKSTGYPFVKLYRSGGEFAARHVHRLVLEAFVGPCPPKMVAAHGNGIRTDNRVENLRWATQSENHRDKEMHGTWQGGSRSSTSKLTEADIPVIDALYCAGETYTAIGKRFGVDYTTIQRAVCRRTWRHVPRPNSPPSESRAG